MPIDLGGGGGGAFSFKDTPTQYGAIDAQGVAAEYVNWKYGTSLDTSLSTFADIFANNAALAAIEYTGFIKECLDELYLYDLFPWDKYEVPNPGIYDASPILSRDDHRFVKNGELFVSINSANLYAQDSSAVPYDAIYANAQTQTALNYDTVAGSRTCYAFDFNRDGTRIYLLDYNRKIVQLSLTTPWDVTTANASLDIDIDVIADIPAQTVVTTSFVGQRSSCCRLVDNGDLYVSFFNSSAGSVAWLRLSAATPGDFSTTITLEAEGTFTQTAGFDINDDATLMVQHGPWLSSSGAGYTRGYRWDTSLGRGALVSQGQAYSNNTDLSSSWTRNLYVRARFDHGASDRVRSNYNGNMVTYYIGPFASSITNANDKVFPDTPNLGIPFNVVNQEPSLFTQVLSSTAYGDSSTNSKPTWANRQANGLYSGVSFYSLANKGFSSDAPSNWSATPATTALDPTFNSAEITSGYAAWANKGRELWVINGGNSDHYLKVYRPKEPYDIRNLVLSQVKDMAALIANMGSQDPNRMAVSYNGQFLYLCDLSGTAVYHFIMSTPWDLSTMTYHGAAGNMVYEPQNFIVSNDGRVCFSVNTRSGQRRLVYSYNTGTPYDFVGSNVAKRHMYTQENVFDSGSDTWPASVNSFLDPTGSSLAVALLRNSTQHTTFFFPIPSKLKTS